MPQSRISVRLSRPDQDDLRANAEHASAAPELMRAVGLDVGRQALIRREVDTFALYTLTDAQTEPSGDTVRMGRGGRGRLDGAAEQEFRARLDGVAVDPGATEEEARRGEKLLEQFDNGDRRGLIVIAPHGGDIEPFTDHQAEHVRDLLRDLGVSCWRCKGWRPGGGAAVRWHITSTDISTASFPRLASAAAVGFRHAVSFHGFVEEGRPDILVGGAAPDALKRVMRAVIAEAVAGTGLRVEIAGPDDPLGGADQANIVNRLTSDQRYGILIEQQPSARSGTMPGSDTPRWQATAAAVADVYRVVLS
jgi:phage replication-related protein YjqB (UPF0714/DUF867 family)